MRVRVQFASSSLLEADVSTEPSWFERHILREKPRDFRVLGFIEMAGGIGYVEDWKQTRVTSRRILDAIWRARIIAEHELRKQAIARRIEAQQVRF